MLSAALVVAGLPGAERDLVRPAIRRTRARATWLASTAVWIPRVAANRSASTGGVPDAGAAQQAAGRPIQTGCQFIGRNVGRISPSV